MAAATPAIVRLLRRVLDEASIPDVVTGPYLADETEARFGAAGRKSRLTRSSATRTPGTRTVVRATAPFHGAADAHLPHQPLNPLSTDGDTVGAQGHGRSVATRRYDGSRHAAAAPAPATARR
jgi:hypothetical protein